MDEVSIRSDRSGFCERISNSARQLALLLSSQRPFPEAFLDSYGDRFGSWHCGSKVSGPDSSSRGDEMLALRFHFGGATPFPTSRGSGASSAVAVLRVNFLPHVHKKSYEEWSVAPGTRHEPAH